MVLRRMCIPGSIIGIIEQVYRKSDNMLFSSGDIAGRMTVTSGIKQVCPMSGSLFALAVDPFLR